MPYVFSILPPAPKHHSLLSCFFNETAEFPFKCDGCKEDGIGSRYKCTSCDFDLHMHCPIPTLTISHPFYPKCSFQFLSRLPGDVPRYCNACEKDVLGFVYHCRACGFDLQPCYVKEKYCEFMGLALQFVVSAVLGDPTALVGGVIGSLIARG